jgi:hypothetical protein
MKITKWMPLAVLICPLLAVADGPSTQPGVEITEPFPGHNFRAYSNQADWDDMVLFMEKNAPNRLRVINESDAYGNFPVRNELLKRWRDYRFVAEHFPEVADLRVKRFQIEDEIFGLELQVRRDPSLLDTIRPEIKLKAAELVNLSIQEHQRRIVKLQTLLTQEQQRLATEQSAQDAEVNARTQRIMERIERDMPQQAPAGPTTQP